MNKICPRCKKPKDTIEFYKNKSREDGISRVCKNCFDAYAKVWYLKNRERVLLRQKVYLKNNLEEFRRRNKEYRDRMRKRILGHYSNGKLVCECCGENHYEFLALDHINGGGKVERKKYQNYQNLYRSIIKRNFPSGYQILCHNCNFAKHFSGKCPHKK